MIEMVVEWMCVWSARDEFFDQIAYPLNDILFLSFFFPRCNVAPVLLLATTKAKTAASRLRETWRLTHVSTRRRDPGFRRNGETEKRREMIESSSRGV